MRFNIWDKGGGERIYITGLHGTGDRTFVQLRRGKLELQSAEFHEDKATVLQTLADHLGIDWPSSADDALYQAARARAAAPQPRSPRGSAALQRVTQPATSFRGPSSYGGQVDGSDLNFTNIRNAEPVLIEVDHREPTSLDDFLSQVENTVVERKHLPLGDVIINGKIVVERKVVSDFAQSVKQHHIFDQAQRMAFAPGTIGVVLIEGDVFREHTGMLASAITGAISCLSLVQGLSVINTLHLEHTAYALAKMGQHDRNGLGYDLPVHKNKPTELINAQRYALEAFNGVSAGLADALLAHFGSVRAVLMASEPELRAVKGIGPKTASRLVEVLTTPYRPR